jgi:hypothetical protein
LEVPLTATLVGEQERATDVTVAAPLAGVVITRFAVRVEELLLQSARSYSVPGVSPVKVNDGVAVGALTHAVVLP